MEQLLEFALPLWGENEKLPDPELVLLYKGFESRHLWLDTDITYENCSMIIKFIQYLNEKESFDDTPIVLHIVSNGGELDIMFMMYHMIKESKIPIYTVNEARCHSAAFLIFLAGHKRFMNPYATFIAHEGSSVMGGTFRETKAAMAQYEKDVDKMCEIIAEETNIDLEHIKTKFSESHDWYINYDEAKAGNIIRE